MKDDGTETTIRSFTLDGGSATLNGEKAGTITFYPTGRVDAVGEIRFFGSEKTHKIRILASGMTRWETE
ncbi:MAG: GspH/FimT family protein [Halobacteriales archaeon]|nr:GspH/FimT family protein [Halobacteriales archaeon]